MEGKKVDVQAPRTLSYGGTHEETTPPLPHISHLVYTINSAPSPSPSHEERRPGEVSVCRGGGRARPSTGHPSPGAHTFFSSLSFVNDTMGVLSHHISSQKLKIKKYKIKMCDLKE